MYEYIPGFQNKQMEGTDPGAQLRINSTTTPGHGIDNNGISYGVICPFFSSLTAPILYLFPR